MFPGTSSNTFRHCPKTDTVLGRQFFIRCFSFRVLCSNLYNEYFIQFMSAVQNTAAKMWVRVRAVSSLSRTVPGIIKPVAKKQMAWPNASAIVASMKNPHTVWDLSIFKRIRKPVGHLPLTAGISGSITPAIATPGPFPASAGFFNLTPKSFSLLCHDHSIAQGQLI